MRIPSKTCFFSLWEAGVLGNRTRLWRDPRLAFVEGFGHLGLMDIGFRELRRPGTAGAGAWCKAQYGTFWDTVHEWQKAGRNFIMDDGAPDQYRTLQGEVCRTHEGMVGFLSLGSKLPMRPDMAAGNMKHYSYAATLRLLEIYMDPPSRDDLDMIFELFPDAAIEFTCFTVKCGVFKRNTLFWEVRNYILWLPLFTLASVLEIFHSSLMTGTLNV